MNKIKLTVTASISLLIAIGLFLSALFVPMYESALQGGVPDYDGEDDIILGEDGYFFRAHGKNSSEYLDYTGQNLFSERELLAVEKSLLALKDSLLSRGANVLFVLVPSKLSVYRDKLPSNVEALYSTVRRYTQIAEVLKTSGLDVIDMTSEFESVAKTEQLFNTGDDTLSDLGAYRVSRAALEYANSEFEKNIRVFGENEFTLSLEHKTGYELADEYNARHGTDYKNATFTLSPLTSPCVPGTMDFENTSHSTVPYAHRDGGYEYISAFICADIEAESTKKFLSPCFSSTVFRKGLVADDTVLDVSSPELGVIIVTENGLDALSASSGALEGDGTDKTVTPIVTDSAHSNREKYVIFGTSEKNSVIKVTGGKKTATSSTTTGFFAIEVELSGGTNNLSLTATAEGKSESDAVSLKAAPDKFTSNREVLVGQNGHLHYLYTANDYIGANLYSEEELADIKRFLEGKLGAIHKVSPDTELIYVIAPNHLTIYPETAPDDLKDKKVSDNSRMKQLIAMMEGSDIKFIDLTGPLLEAKANSPYPIYNKTDTHWNELGAYYASSEILKYIAKDYPAAAPEPLSSFNVFQRSVAGGDMASFLGVDLNHVREDGVFVRSKTPLKSGINKDYTMNFANAWFSDRHVFNIESDSLPTMIMWRDSFTTNMMSFLAEKFSYSHFYPMSDSTFDIDLIAEVQPDYIIVEIVERNLAAGVMY